MRNFLQNLNNLKNLMTNFKEAWVNFVNFVNFVMQNFKSVVGYRLPVMEAVCAAEGTQKERQYPTNLQRIFNLSLTPNRLRSVCALVVLLMVMGVANAWGGNCPYTLNDAVLTSYTNKDNSWRVPSFYLGYIDNEYGISHIHVTGDFTELSSLSAAQHKFKLQYKIGENGSLSDVSGASDVKVGNSQKDIYNNSVSIAATPGKRVYLYLLTSDGGIVRFSNKQKFEATVEVRMAKTLPASVAAINFGDVTIGNNTDSTRSIAYSCEVTGKTMSVARTSGSTDFTASLNSTSLDCSGARTLTVRFTPSSEGAKSATFTVSSNNGASSVSFSVSGNGKAIVKPIYKWNTVETTTYSIGDTYFVEGASLNLNTLWTSSSPATKSYSMLSFTPASGNHTGATAPALAGTTLSLGQAGTVRLRVAQNATTGYYADADTIDLVINRRPNTISCSWGSWSKDVNFDSKTRVKFSSDNDAYAPIVVTQILGKDTATYKEAVSSANPDTLIANYHVGPAVWQISQAEDYKYEVAVNKNCTINVGTVTSTGCYVLENQSSTEYGYHGNTYHEHTWSEENAAGVVRFEISKNAGYDQGYKVQQKIGSDWVDVTNYKNDHSTSWGDWKTETLNKAAKGVRFMLKGGSLNYVRNVSVSKAEYVATKNTSGSGITNLDMPSRLPSGAATNATFYVDYSTCDDVIKLASDNSHITFANGTTSYQFSTENSGRKSITLTYDSDEAEEIAATITVYTKYEHDTLTVHAETKSKLATTLEYIGSNAYAVDAENIAATSLFRVRDENGDLVASPAITLSTSATSVIDTVSGKTAVDFLCGGTARITASYAGDATYAAASNKDTLITVNKLTDTFTWRGIKNDTVHVWADSDIPSGLVSVNADVTVTYSTLDDGSKLSVTDGTTLHAGIHGVVALTAVSEGDCTYAPKSESKYVSVDPCDHRVVWAQDFTGLHTDEDGAIDYTATLNAYAVDSLGVATGVTISYSTSDTSIAKIVDGNKLHVKKIGEATVYATTAADDKYAVVTEPRKVRVLTWGENHAKIKGTDWADDNRSWRGNHATFTFSGTGKQHYNDGITGTYLEIDTNTDYQISWTIDDGCTITVKAIECKMGNTSSWGNDYKVKINNTEVGTVKGWNSNDKLSLSGLSLGNDGSITLSADNGGPDIYWIDITYTITPDTPVPTDGVSEVLATVDPLSPVTLDLGDLFSVADAPDDFEYVCDLVTENDHAHIVGAGTQFWADSAGDYTIKGKVAVAEDHRSSAWGSTYKTIRVVRQLNKVFMGGSDSYSDTIKLQSTKLNVWLTATNTDYSGSPITCTQIAGMDTIRYNPSTGVFTSGNILGTGKWRVSQAQSDKYEAAADTFTVEIVNNTFEFTGETDGDWGKDGNWGASGKPTAKDNVTISGDLTVDEEIEVYSLTITGEAVVTIGSNGGLSVGAGGISGSTKDNLILEAGDGTGGTTKGKTGYIRFSPDYAEAMPEVTVKMYTIGYYDKTGGADKNDAAWQYVGAPVDFAGKLAKTVFTRSWIYDYNESTDKWANNRSRLVMEPFVGYATTQYDNEDGMKLAYTGKLINNRGVVTLDLAYSGSEYGHNMVANSFAAPIDITQLRDTDFVNAEQTIYIFNTGSRNQEDKSVNGDAAGQYRTIAIGTASEMSETFEGDPSLPTTIAPMQGFWVNATSAGAKLKLDYNKLVWNADYSTHVPGALRAPKRALVEDEAEMEDEEEKLPITGAMKITMEAAGWSDHVYMLESERYDALYEDGYDAHKMESGNLNVFVMAGNDKLAIDATPQISGTQVGVRTGEETTYTLHFSYVQGETKWALKDYEAKAVIDINEGTEYTFIAVPNCDIIGRFEIVERADAPAVATGVDSATGEVNVQKFVKDGNLYVLKNGMLYNATGMRVK